MPVIVGENKSQINQAPYYKRMIRCPGHWLISPKVEVYLREPVPLLKDCSDFVELKGQRIKIRKTRIAKDRWGNKKIDWKKLYELRKTGQVLNPIISAGEAIERIYDPKSMLCILCDKRCKEGRGNIITSTIKRLMGIPIKRK